MLAIWSKLGPQGAAEARRLAWQKTYGLALAAWYNAYMTNSIAYHTDDYSTVALGPGAIITDFRHEEWVFDRVSRPASPGRLAKVEVHDPTDPTYTREFYASVFPGLEVI